ncbi:ankyrin and armadillo repeat-containing protein isoform X1 [Crotalus tigris]|uniref:ankyrin and armadillo repeat-containing protein isoform X1 n=2 Tax=Crotalus tigris TaxID=88082 RepID=UPI00192F2623|nr:ankyrin and armadillo repeat-containing protein isoform X1 [Crotalus tigris]XP_039178032.1 ankyrin and armadillo repeat-containing protein isoform X1 [Crotalus tigris]
MLRPIKKQALRNEQADEAAYLAHLAAQRNASAFFEKYERSELQELLTTSFCSWLASKDDMRHPLELPSGLLSQMKSINTSIAIILMPVEPGLDLDCREIHQMIRELAVGIYCLNQIPSISLDANYDQSTSCSLPPGYFDTRIGQILIAVDYMLKALWHGVYMPKEKRVRFSELWRSSMDIDQDGVPQTLKTPAAEFCQAGLIDITKEPEFRGIYDENMNEDPTYNPNSVEEKMFFMQFADHIILKLTFATTKIQQYEDVFLFDAAYNLTNAIRMTEDHLDAFSYQRLQQRLTLQLKLVKKHLEKKEDIQKNIAYMKLICFLIPFIINLKRKNKVPNLSRLLQPYSDDKVKTERELPPFMLGTDFKCQHFLYAQNQYFHLHGGIEFDVGTPSVEDVSKEVKAAYDEMHTCAINHLTQLLDPDAPYREHYSIPVMDFDGKRYYVIGIELEAFYMLFKSQWWGAINEIISILKPKRLPLTDTQAMDQFKKRFGYKKAIKCKSLSFGMKSAADRGLAAIFLTFCRRTSINSLAITDDNGYAYIHHAAIYNRVAIIAQVVKLHLTINQKRSIPASQGKRFQRPETKSGRPAFIEKDVMIGEKSSWGPTALHLAAQCSSLEALHFLLALRADYQIPDDRGWLPIHFAAYYDNVACITVLYRKNAELIEAETQSLYHSTPLLLAAVSGALDSMKYLFSLKANWLKKDSEGNNIIHLAALNFHTEVLKHLIELNSPDLPVWKTLVGMLNCESYSRKKMAIRCLEVLCLAKDDYWKCILQAGTIPSLISLLKSKDVKLECITLGVLSNISTHDSIVRAFVEAGGIPVLIKLLTMEEPELLSRCAVFLYDIAQLDNNQVIIAELGGIPALIDLLEYDLQDLLVNVMSCIRVLCKNNKENQLKVKEMIGIEPLVQFLRSDSDVLVAVASAVIAEISRGNMEMQNAIVAANVIDPLIQLLRGRKISVQVKGAMAIEALCEGNTLIQMKFLSRSVTKFLLKLLKAFHLKVKEQGAVTLWALAGQTLKQQKFMAEQIGYNLIIDMLLSPSDKMQCVGGEAVIALSKDSEIHQNQICEGNGIAPLVRLLRSGRIAEGTLLSVIKALGTMCVGEAHISNPLSQENVVDEGALPILVHLLKTHPSLQIKVEVAFSLACIVLKNSSLQTVLQEKEGFCYLDVLKLFYAPDKDIRLRAGYAIAIFAYNNPTQQILILESGPISIHIFEPLLGSDVETDRAMAAFQIVILAKIIINMDQVSLSARGISILVDLLCSEKSTTLVLTGKLIASLAHTRAGIPEAITSLGTVQRLCYHLYAKEEEVRSAVACALGYLTFNRTAYRHLLVQCRNKPKLFKRLIINLSKDAKINSDFVKEFKRQKKVGLPSLSLEINGGPPAVPVHIREKFRGTGVKVYKGKFRPKDSLFLIPSTSHIMGRLKTPEKPRIPASGHYQFPHTTTSDLIEVSRPRIVNVEALKHSLSKEKF